MTDGGRSPAINASAAAVWSDRVLDGLQRRERLGLALAIGLQIVVLVGMIAYWATPLVTGDTILLRVIPVDPRDLFRGDYVILSYDFSRGPIDGIEGLPSYGRYSSGQTVYVSLTPEEDGQHWRTERISVTRPSSGRYLRGRLDWYGQIECGIEAFYVQEGTGLEYEQAVRSQKLSAEVAVTTRGRARLRNLRIE